MPLESLEDRCLLASGFLQTNLVADTPGLARVTDPNLINPWGLAFSPAGPFWIADGGTGVSTLYNAAGQSPVPGSSLVVQLPPAGVELSGTAGAPTGVVFNDGPSFQVAEGGKSAPSLFLFATEDGAIAGWNPRVDPYRAVLAVDNSASAAGAVYTGLALADTPAGTFLYAANFHTGTIDVFDQDFHPVHGAGAFADPSLPAGYAPFNIQDLGGRLYVTYALQDAARQEDAAGPGHGFLDVFDLQGHRLQRLASQGPLNSPWGLALAPEDFGAFRNDLLVGNFGDGHINAFDPATGAFLGRLQDARGQPLTIPNLWGLLFGNNGLGGDADTLFFTAGIGNRRHGLFGSLQALTGNAGSGSPGASEVYVTGSESSHGDNYPLPPANGPALHGGSEGIPPPLPALLPFRELAPVPGMGAGKETPAAPALPTGFLTMAERRAEAMPPAASRIPVLPWSLAAASESMPAPVSDPDSPLALDLLLDLSSPGNTLEKPAGSGPMTRRTSVRACSHPPDKRGRLSYEPKATLAPVLSTAAEPQAEDQRSIVQKFTNLWTPLVLALGVHLAWCYQRFLDREPSAPGRRPQKPAERT